MNSTGETYSQARRAVIEEHGLRSLGMPIALYRIRETWSERGGPTPTSVLVYFDEEVSGHVELRVQDWNGELSLTIIRCLHLDRMQREQFHTVYDAYREDNVKNRLIGYRGFGPLPWMIGIGGPLNEEPYMETGEYGNPTKNQLREVARFAEFLGYDLSNWNPESWLLMWGTGDIRDVPMVSV